MEPARQTPASEWLITRSPYFQGPLHERMSNDLHLADMARCKHEGYLQAVRPELGFHAETHIGSRCHHRCCDAAEVPDTFPDALKDLRLGALPIQTEQSDSGSAANSVFPGEASNGP